MAEYIDDGRRRMKLDESFAREIRRVANGDGSPEHEKAFRAKLREVRQALSSPNVMVGYDAALGAYGRVPVAICTAATILERRDVLHERPVRWAEEVLKCWTKRTGANLEQFYIRDELDPSRIEQYAASLVRYTLED